MYRGALLQDGSQLFVLLGLLVLCNEEIGDLRSPEAILPLMEEPEF